MSGQIELRQQITARIVAALEKQLIPWRRPWHVSPNAGRPANCLSRRCYSGVNPLLLNLHADEFGFRSRWWGTYQQWSQWGCQVQPRPTGVEPGLWGAKIVLFKPVSRTVIDAATGDEDERAYCLLKTFTVFNAEQVTGRNVEQFFVADPVLEGGGFVDFQPCEDLIAATHAEIHHFGEQAVYQRPKPDGSFPKHTDGDFIVVPPKFRFESVAGYYETVLHELAHWCEARLRWEGSYAMGELIAEISATFVGAELGVPNSDDLTNHSSYLQNWIAAMKGDPSFIFKAGSQASKVADYLLGFVRPELPQPERTQII